MSSSISYEKCPQCGGAYVIEFDCRTLEEYCFCNRCGKTNNFIIVRDKDGKAIMEDEDKRIPKYSSKNSDGYGCLAIAGKKGVTAVYHYDHPVDVEQIKSEYLNILKESAEEIDEEGCYLTYWDDEKKEIVALFGKLPRSYDEIMGEDEENETLFNEVENKEEHMKTYNKLIGISDNNRKELNSIEDVAQFICREGLTSDVRIEYEDGSLLLDTFGTFINKITDMEYREELLKVLVPMQKKLDGSDGCCNY